MDYLTNYYKNICEQLQEKLNILEAQLNEYGPSQLEAMRRGEYVDPCDSDMPPPDCYKRQITPSFQPKPQPKPQPKMVPGPTYNVHVKPPMPKPLPTNQPDGETDEDIIRMRQTAADQGGIPQDMVNEPIERTKQLPDGSTIRSKTVQPPKVRPNIGGAGPMIPKKPLPYPTPAPKGETMIPKVLDGFKKEQEFDNRMGIIPQTPEQRKRFGMSPFDNRMS